MKHILAVVAISLFWLGMPVFANTAVTKPADHDSLQQIKALFEIPAQQIDLARAKLTIDKLVDPSIDVENALNSIDKMVKTLETGLASDMMPLDKILSLSALLLEQR